MTSLAPQSMLALAAIRSRVEAAGFDLVAPCAASDYDAEVPAELRLPAIGRSHALAVVIGNSRALWPRFVAALRRDPALVEAADPLDGYTERTITAAVSAAVPAGVAWALRFAHQPPPHQVAIQRLARLARLAHVSSSHLCVHPTLGPWIALRAVAVIDLDGPPARPALVAPCECSRGCAPALAAALAEGSLVSEDDLAARWRTWVAVRDACPIGRGHRYDDDQLRYHYTKDRDILRRLARREVNAP